MAKSVVTEITSNLKFWSSMKFLFSNKSKGTNTVTLNEKDKVLKEETKVLKAYNNYLDNLTKNLKLKTRPSNLDASHGSISFIFIEIPRQFYVQF